MPYLDIPVPLRWADVDAYAHVNNAALLTILEEARIAAFWADDVGRAAGTSPGGAPDAPGHRTALLEAGPGAATQTVIARQEVEYLLPIPYGRAPLVVRLWLSAVGGASIDVSYEVRRGETLYARAVSVIVLVDAATGRPRRITPDERETWTRHVAPPVEFRHRR